MERVLSELEHAEETGEPYALLGASYSFVHLFEELEQLGKTFSLPKGSKILDTGGYKNQSKELELNEFYQLLSTIIRCGQERLYQYVWGDRVKHSIL